MCFIVIDLVLMMIFRPRDNYCRLVPERPDIAAFLIAWMAISTSKLVDLCRINASHETTFSRGDVLPLGTSANGAIVIMRTMSLASTAAQ